MGMIRARVNLTAAKFPLFSTDFGRSVIINGSDTSYTPGLNPNEDGLIPVNDRNIPQVIYCENVMPSTEGVAAVGYETTVYPFTSVSPFITGGTIQQVVVVSLADGSYTYVGVVLQAGSYVYVKITPSGVAGVPSSWSLIDMGVYPLTGYTGGQVTSAYVNGKTYIYFAGAADPCRELTVINQLLPVTLTSFSANLVDPPIGIFSSSGYLLGWSKSRITWSSTLTATDFTPSLATGAGATQLQEAASNITFVRAHPRGAVVFTKLNAVGLTYTNNKNFPWNIKAISGGGGVEEESLISVAVDEMEFLYAYTTYGLQKFNTLNCKAYLPEVTNFLASGRYETYDSGTQVFTQYNLSPALSETPVKRLCLVNNRFLCITYGVNFLPLTYALVIDIHTQRWGKIKTDAAIVGMFEIKDLFVRDREDDALRNIGTLASDGQVKSLVLKSTAGAGVLYLGYYQYIRNRLIQLQKVLGVPNTCTVHTKIYQINVATPITETGTVIATKTHGFPAAAGMTIAVAIHGPLNLPDLLLEFNNHGRN